jgi:hypothetical protein
MVGKDREGYNRLLAGTILTEESGYMGILVTNPVCLIILYRLPNFRYRQSIRII